VVIYPGYVATIGLSVACKDKRKVWQEIAAAFHEIGRVVFFN
jgi:hypothetical protein